MEPTIVGCGEPDLHRHRLTVAMKPAKSSVATVYPARFPPQSNRVRPRQFAPRPMPDLRKAAWGSKSFFKNLQLIHSIIQFLLYHRAYGGPADLQCRNRPDSETDSGPITVETARIELAVQGHDVRVVRQPGRAQAERARGRRGDGQLRHRAAAVQLRLRRGRYRELLARSRQPATAPPPGRGGRRRRQRRIAAEGEKDAELRDLRTRLRVAIALSVPIALIAMIPPLQFDYWQWLSLLLATPVVFWAAGRSTGSPGATSATAPRRWTR